MKIIIRFVFYVWIGGALSLAFGNENTAVTLVYSGTSDASAAVAIGRDMFIVADDENNVLRVYKTTQGGLPLFSYDITEFLDIEPKYPEVDIEGATMIGRRIYWISSHGRNKDGKTRPNRYRFFATIVKSQDGNVTIEPVGKPCKTLIQYLVKSDSMRYLRLDRATRFDTGELPKKEQQKLAPKKEGLNIEGLCTSADGKTIYIGFRNPRPFEKISQQAKAIIVPLINPDDVLEKNRKPIFDEPILLDLAGLGIRSMEYSNFHKAYFIIAGTFDDSPMYAIYRWSGKKERPPVLVKQLRQSDFSPEAMITFKNSDKFFALSDDGSLQIKVDGAWECMEGEYRKDGTCQNKYLLDPEKKTFRGIWLAP
ncbi:MAG: DUF3616 domain-containing protein [Planctomycetes bacterium]|nr:DUF3616 domain-containing protein [Planctomycetota bacterium]MBL7142652.1 DUF3616 domain-containing protein [Phycisphaerae bacterium]